jgi:hypothetical protein
MVLSSLVRAYFTLPHYFFVAYNSSSIKILIGTFGLPVLIFALAGFMFGYLLVV